MQSHHRAALAQQSEVFSDEIIPLYDPSRQVYEQDNGVGPDSTIEDLGKLRANFDLLLALLRRVIAHRSPMVLRWYY